jgi:hypothetical protein
MNYVSNINNSIQNKYYTTIKEIQDYLIEFCNLNNYKNILEIGPGNFHFPIAKKFVGCNEKIEKYINIDIDEEPLPFLNKELDFIYSRHVLEDIQNPNFAFKEIIRCSKSGYIETPSPLIEITKGVDSYLGSEKYTGYLHHRYIIWADIEKCEIFFLPKYSSIIDNFLQINNFPSYYNLVNNQPLHWNNYFLWKDKTPKITMYKNGVNFHLTIDNYIKLLNEAIDISIKNTEFFRKLIFKM